MDRLQGSIIQPIWSSPSSVIVVPGLSHGARELSYLYHVLMLGYASQDLVFAGKPFRIHTTPSTISTYHSGDHVAPLSVLRKICPSGHHELSAGTMTVPGHCKSTNPKYRSPPETVVILVQVPAVMSYL